MTTRTALLTLLLAACKPAPVQPVPPSPMPMAEVVSPRKGVQTRVNAPASAPLHGLRLDSNGLVNETFVITVDLDLKTITRVTKFAKNGSEEKVRRALTDAEVASLKAEREKVWREWTELERQPAAEYLEHLFLCDGEAVTGIRAEGGFPETGVSGALAHRLRSLAVGR